MYCEDKHTEIPLNILNKIFFLLYCSGIEVIKNKKSIIKIYISTRNRHNGRVGTCESSVPTQMLSTTEVLNI